MNKFYIEISNNETILYESTWKVFFILKERNGTYYTSQVYEYEPIVNELKDWVLKLINNDPQKLLKSFSYDEIIKPMFRAYTREEKLNELGI